MNSTEKLREEMKQKGLDAVLITSELNERYLSKYPFTDGLLVITLKHAALVTDFRYYEDAGKKADKAYEVVMPIPRIPFIMEFLKNDDVKTVGFEDTTLPVSELERYKKLLPDFTFIGLGETIEKIREVKDEDELEYMAKAQNAADAALAHLLTMITPEMTEIDVALELEFFMRHAGAEAAAFETIAISGSASSLPHGKPRNIKLQPGFLTMDFGALWNGYCSDMTRTVCVGKADAEMKKLYNTVLKAQLESLEAIKAGVTGESVDKIARDIIDAEPEYKGTFGHSLGHGVGMFIHESPRLSTRAKEKLVPGNVVTCEPGIYVFGKYGCRIEDMVAVTENGYRNFTKSPKELIELF